MKNFNLSMTKTLATIYPLFELNNVSKTKLDLSALNFRLIMVNQLLVACIETIDKNPNFWAEIDLVDFKKYLTENKAVVFDMQHSVSDHSREMAILDQIKSNIHKLETALVKATAFNFDLARMQERLEDDFYEVPQEVTNITEFQQWLKGIANGH